MKNTTNANAWTFTRNSVTVNGQTFPASCSLARGGDVYVFTTPRVADGTDMPIRIHVGQDMPMHAEAVAAAKPAEVPAPVQDKPASVQEAPANKPAAVDKPWIGTTITGKG